MAVITNGITDTLKITLSTNDHGQPTWNKTILVEVDSKDDSNLVAEAAIGAVIGDPFRFKWDGPVTDSRAVLTGANTSISSTTDDGYVYQVDLTYSQIENSSLPSDPLNSPAEFTWSYEQREIVIDYDANGLPILNSAGDKYDPPVTTEIYILKLSISQNESSYNPALALAYGNKVNSDAFQGAAAGQVLCESVTASGPIFENDVQYYKLSYNFAFRADGWKKEMLSTGMRELDDNGKLQNIKIKGSEISSPLALDINGKAITDNTGTTVKQTYDIKGQLPFSGTFNFR